MIKRIFFYVFIISLFSSCFSSKTTSFEEMMKTAPDWVRRTPGIPGFYHGVGTATKNNSSDFRERAQQSALSELANSISVNVSSSSVLNSFQNNNSYTEYYKTNSKISSQEFLEGYELVDSWETKDQYWVYYRLSRMKYEQIKQDRINRALNTSISKYEEANNFRSQGNGIDAFRSYILAIEDISDFLGEELTYKSNGVERPYATQLSNDFISNIRNMRVVYPSEKLVIKRGAIPSGMSIEAKVVDENNKTLSGIPIISRLSWQPGSTFESVSDANGNIRITPRNIDSKRRLEQVNSVVDIDKLVRINTSSMMVRKLLEGVKVDNFVFPIEIVPPTVSVKVLEGESGKLFQHRIIENELISLLRQDGFNYLQNAKESDFEIIVEIFNAQAQQNNGRFAASINTNFTVNDNTGRNLYNASENNVTGIGNTKQMAEDDALKSLNTRIRIGAYPNMKRAVF